MMDARQLAQVLLRLWGVALIIWAIASVGSLLMLFVPVSPLEAAAAIRATRAAAALHIVVYFVAGIILVRQGDRLGAWLTSDLELTGAPASAIEVRATAFAILGAYFFVRGIESAASVVAALVADWRGSATVDVLWGYQRQNAIAAPVYLIAGILLLAGHKNVPAVLKKLWRGLRSQSDSE